MVTDDASQDHQQGPGAVPRKPPWSRSWWVDDHLLAGAYPGSTDLDEATVKVGALIDAGVTLFLDLTTSRDHLKPYEPLLAELDPSGRVRRHALPVADLHAPTAGEVQRALGLIDAEAERGGITYVHCWGGIGRTGSIVGCYLARDIGGDAALRKLIELRRGSADADRRAPETEAQRALVRGWDRRPLSDRPRNGGEA